VPTRQDISTAPLPFSVATISGGARFALAMSACSRPIRRELIAAGHETPEPGRIEPCAICRLELVLSDDRTRMVVAPLDSGKRVPPSPR
jgi:hypothetical protein